MFLGLLAERPPGSPAGASSCRQVRKGASPSFIGPAFRGSVASPARTYKRVIQLLHSHVALRLGGTMPSAGEVEATDWEAVLARAAAYLCLRQADMESASILDKGEFLMRLGVPRADAAKILGTTDESLRVSASRRRSASGSKRATATKSPAKKASASRGRRG